jgi:hypothetical protein
VRVQRIGHAPGNAERNDRWPAAASLPVRPAAMVAASVRPTSSAIASASLRGGSSSSARPSG